MPRYKLTVAYDGTWFHGWQKQQRADRIDHEQSPDPQSPGIAIPGLSGAESTANPSALRTVQSVLERAAREVVCEPIILTGASRTDSGVHAKGQVAAFTTQREFPVEKLSRALNSRLPDDVQVLDAKIVPDEFDPISDAIAKGYRYRIAHGCARGPLPLFDRHFVMRYPHRLDVETMNEAARMLLGEHDFTSFARMNHGRETAVRTIFDCKVSVVSRRRCVIEVAGNGFLYNMVRIIAGTLVEVGRGRIAPEKMPEILSAKDRRAAGPTLPPTGLCLMWIKYADETRTPPASPA